MEKEVNIDEYEILLDMEDFCRSNTEAEEESSYEGGLYSKKAVLDFCKLFKDAVSKMNREEKFEDNLVDFGETLNPVEEDILFDEIAVPFYESWVDLLEPEESQKENANFFNMTVEQLKDLIAKAEKIVRILDSMYGYDYFDAEEVEEK